MYPFVSFAVLKKLEEEKLENIAYGYLIFFIIYNEFRFTMNVCMQLPSHLEPSMVNPKAHTQSAIEVAGILTMT